MNRRKRLQGALMPKRATIFMSMLTLVLVAPALAAQPDGWITTKSKLAVLTSADVGATAVSVDTVNQSVTLHGKVRSPQEKANAETVVKGIDGVREVRNLLEVVAPSRQAAVQRSDDEIALQVSSALRAQSSLKDSAIEVRSVNNGAVLLGGTAKTLTSHLSAVEVASGVPGVRRVASEIQSPDTLAEAEIWRVRTVQESRSDYNAADASRDVWITSMVKLRLLADGQTPALDINVDTRDGVVTLFGIVPRKEVRRVAEADAQKVSGVRHVSNELQVVASKEQPAVKARDQDVQRDVKKSLEEHADLKDIDIAVKNCVARLTGTVPSGTQRLQAAVVARSTSGVCSVQDDLRIAG